MANQRVLLREPVKDLGSVGDIVDVAPGYARNFLFPKGLAVEATDENKKAMERRRERYEAELVKREADIGKRIAALGNVRLTAREKADETGTLYGSVAAATIAKLLSEAGHPTEEKDVRLEEPIKSVGTFDVPIHVRGEHYAAVQIVVEAEV